jgi:hypothetical protein
MTSWPAAARDFIDHWQTLIAGILALLAGVGAIAATMRTARQEIEASQAQTKVTQRIERRRIASEEYAFSAMLSAAMVCVVQDVAAARELATHVSDDKDRSSAASDARQRIRKIGFNELRTACLTHGGQLTRPFLKLEKEIDDLSSSSKLSMESGITRGAHRGLHAQLTRIDDQARAIDREATKGMERCAAVLAETPNAP